MGHLFGALASAALLVSAVALAQSEDESGGDEAIAPEGSATVAPSAEAGAPSDRDAAQAQHTVERGDTLWDLSQKYLGSPWYWPKVWSYNPEIANPHWIYPGNLVRFFQAGEEVPTQVEVGAPEATDVEEGQMVEEDRVQVSSPIGYRVKAGVSISLPGLVTPGEIEATGRIVGSFAESQMLSFPDTMYVRFKDRRTAKNGETYVVFRPGDRLLHPVTRDPVGFYSRIMGEVRVVRVDRGGIVTMQIVRQFDEIERTDLIGPAGEPLIRRVIGRPADRDVTGGVIVAGTPTARAMYGEHNIVVIDRGSEHGVKPGYVFTIWRQHDALPQDVVLNPTVRDEELPVEDVGECIAAEVKSSASICLLSRSLREFVPGDRADVRASSGPRAAR